MSAAGIAGSARNQGKNRDPNGPPNRCPAEGLLYVNVHLNGAPMSPHSAPLPFLGLGSDDGLRALADALPDALFTTDLEGRITYWNPAAARITGWSQAEALGRDCSLLAGDAVHGCACGVGPLRCALAQQGRSSKSCTTRSRDGRLLQIVKSAVPLYAPDGSMIGALETFTEVAPPVPVAAGVADGGGDFCGLVGRHPAMLDLYRTIDLVARSESTVMILGESGSGKECVAEAIHLRSRRAQGPFVRVSCSALNENLLESELFGHVRGAFTGALRDRRGRFQEADGGTLLLDEIGDISPLVQVKLLRVIEQRQIERVGDSQPVRVDVRLLCATHRDLKALVQAGRFRADLYFRLAVFPVRVPPLRDRIEDLPLLARRHLSSLEPARLPVAARTLAALQCYPWPGNVRELQNVLEFAALRAQGREIEPDHLPEEIANAPSAVAAHAAPAAARGATILDRERVVAALETTTWNRARAARLLGVSRVTLWKRMKEFGIEEPP
jgi:two-component system, NtrC family, response regulator HydG